MPSRTLGDKVEELTILSATLTEKMRAIDEALTTTTGENAETAKAVAELKTYVSLLTQQLAELKTWKDALGTLGDWKTELALLRREAEEMKKWQDDVKRREEERGRKAWMIVPPVLAALLTALLTALITYLNRK